VLWFRKESALEKSKKPTQNHTKKRPPPMSNYNWRGYIADFFISSGIASVALVLSAISFHQTIEREGGDIISIPLPIRVEPRGGVSLTSNALPASTNMFGLRSAYVTTACGVTKTSKIR
jgi:hypothetical protein